MEKTWTLRSPSSATVTPRQSASRPMKPEARDAQKSPQDFSCFGTLILPPSFRPRARLPHAISRAGIQFARASPTNRPHLKDRRGLDQPPQPPQIWARRVAPQPDAEIPLPRCRPDPGEAGTGQTPARNSRVDLDSFTALRQESTHRTTRRRASPNNATVSCGPIVQMAEVRVLPTLTNALLMSMATVCNPAVAPRAISA